MAIRPKKKNNKVKEPKKGKKRMTTKKLLQKIN
jgi:hypothetical protein